MVPRNSKFFGPNMYVPKRAKRLGIFASTIQQPRYTDIHCNSLTLIPSRMYMLPRRPRVGTWRTHSWACQRLHTGYTLPYVHHVRLTSSVCISTESVWIIPTARRIMTTYRKTLMVSHRHWVKEPGQLSCMFGRIVEYSSGSRGHVSTCLSFGYH